MVKRLHFRLDILALEGVFKKGRDDLSLRETLDRAQVHREHPKGASKGRTVNRRAHG